MMIYGEIDNRLEQVVTFDDFPVTGNYLWVVHPNDPDLWIESELAARLSDQNCNGVLLIKGVPRSGLSREQFGELKSKHGERFHACTQAIGMADERTRLCGELETRLRAFFEKVRFADTIDWNLLEPQCSVVIVSGYLLAKVLAADCQEAELIDRRRPEWKAIWEDVCREYELLTGLGFPHLELNRITARDRARALWEYLHISNAIVSSPRPSGLRKSVRVASA